MMQYPEDVREGNWSCSFHGGKQGLPGCWIVAGVIIEIITTGSPTKQTAAKPSTEKPS